MRTFLTEPIARWCVAGGTDELDNVEDIFDAVLGESEGRRVGKKRSTTLASNAASGSAAAATGDPNGAETEAEAEEDGLIHFATFCREVVEGLPCLMGWVGGVG